MQKIKYINNRDLLAEIHKSKTTYCHFISPEYAQYDAIVGSIDQLTPEFLAATLHSKQVKLAKTANGLDVPTLTSQDVVFRVMADNHLPEEADERSRRRSSTGGWVSKTNFPPFQHYMFTDGILVEVGRSHWKDDLETGSFCTTHGKMTHRLASMFLLLVQQYSSRGNWRGYSYVSDMRGQALVQLSQVGLQFDESRSDNPFAWYTQIIKNAFRRILLLEKRNHEIRDDLLIMSGAMPSYTRQVEDEMEQREKDISHGSHSEGTAIRAEQPKRRGRRPKTRVSIDDI